MNPSSPESIIASARALAAMGSKREAECLLRGALARAPDEGVFRSALMGLSFDAASGSWPPLSILQVEQWIRDGMLVEALSVLCGCSFGEDGQRWAHFLGELLAPPPDSEETNRPIHQAMLRGGASVAMTSLEDMSHTGPLSSWADRRLQLLRWMLIDNAQSAPRDSQVDALASPLAKALFAPLERRDLEGMAEAARNVEHKDAALAAAALERLALEVQKQGSPDAEDKRTIQHMGRAAAAMQLHMTAFENARVVYEQMLTKAAEPEVAQLLVAVQGVERVLIGRPYNHRSFAVPKANRFDDATKRHPDQRALAKTPAAIGGTGEGLGFDDQTRVAASAEIPLAAFGDDVTRPVVLPEARPRTSAPSFGDEVTRIDARLATSVNEVTFDDVTVRGDLAKSPLAPGAPAPAFATEDTLSFEDAERDASLAEPTLRDDLSPGSVGAPTLREKVAPPSVETPGPSSLSSPLSTASAAQSSPVARVSVIVAPIVAVGAESSER